MTNLSTSERLAAMINKSEESFTHGSGISFTIDELRAAVESPGSNVRLPDDSLVEALHDMLDKMKDEPYCIDVAKASLSPAHYGMISGMFKLNVCMPDGEGWVDKTGIIFSCMRELLTDEYRKSIAAIRVLDSVSLYDEFIKKAFYDYLPPELSERFPFRLLD